MSTTRMPATKAEGVGLHPKADQHADHGHEGHDQHVAGEVGQGAPGEHGRARHGQGVEALEQPALDVGRQADRRVGRAKGDRLHEYAGHEVVDVGDAAGDLDGPAEHVTEQRGGFSSGMSTSRGPLWVSAPEGRPSPGKESNAI